MPAPNTSASIAPPKAPKPPEPSDAAKTCAGCAGSVTFMICTMLSSAPAAKAYVRPSMPNISTACAPPRDAQLCRVAKHGGPRGRDARGSVTFMICNPPPSAPATRAYVRPSMPNTSTSCAPAKAPNPAEWLNTAYTGTGSPTTGLTCPAAAGRWPAAAAVSASSANIHFSMSRLCPGTLMCLVNPSFAAPACARCGPAPALTRI